MNASAHSWAMVLGNLGGCCQKARRGAWVHSSGLAWAIALGSHWKRLARFAGKFRAHLPGHSPYKREQVMESSVGSRVKFVGRVWVIGAKSWSGAFLGHLGANALGILGRLLLKSQWGLCECLGPFLGDCLGESWGGCAELVGRPCPVHGGIARGNHWGNHANFWRTTWANGEDSLWEHEDY